MDYKKELEDALERARKLDSPFYRQAAEIIFLLLKENAAKIFKLADELKSREVKSIWKPTPEQTSILWDVVCTLKHDNYKHTDIIIV